MAGNKAELDENLCAALADICRAAAARYQEHVKSLADLGGRKPAYGEMSQVFFAQMLQAQDFADAFAESGSRLGAIAAGVVSAKRSCDEIMALAEAYADAKVRARDSNRDTWVAAENNVREAGQALREAIESQLALDPALSADEGLSFRP